jgi:hypothetical protein
MAESPPPQSPTEFSYTATAEAVATPGSLNGLRKNLEPICDNGGTYIPRLWRHFELSEIDRQEQLKLPAFLTTA